MVAPFLEQVLIPFVLAMGLFYSLVPIVDFLSIQPGPNVKRGARGPEGRGRSGGGVRMGVRKRVDADDFKTDCIGRLDESECPPPPPMLKALHAASAWCRGCVSSFSWLAKHRLPRSLAVIIALIGAVLVIAAIMVVIISSINDLALHSEKYATRMKAMVGWILRWVKPRP